ncbi:MAG: TAXI family TRAP transporter solute-binding subunit [Alphaproteobacteria bacterium]|nr:TAXI family TRAP transporter solute-binding subunit [Alphaproteobacteria bacterium]
MKRHALLLLALLCGAPLPNAAAPLTLSLGTATEGGGFAAYGDALAAAVATADPELRVATRMTEGSAVNVPMLEDGRLDLALIQGTSAHEALAGIGRPPADLPVVAAMYSSAGMFVVRADAPYRAIGDLAGRRVVLGAAGSGLVVLARYVLDGLGFDPQRDFTPVLLERAGDGPAMVVDGGAAALWGGGVGWPGFARVAAGPVGARFIGLSAEEVARVQAKHPFLKPMTVPAGAYPGIDRPLTTVGSRNLVLARRSLPDDAAYRFSRALHRAEADLARRLPQAAETTTANTVAALGGAARLHPGAARYLREIGALR